MDASELVENSRNIRRVLIITLVMNEAVALAKLWWGYKTGSVGIISDGYHSLFDGVTNVMGLVGIWIAAHPPDKEHPYGHRKFETLVTAIVSVMIFLTCFEVLKSAWEALKNGTSAQIGIGSFVVMLTTMSANFVVMKYEAAKGRELKNDFLMVDALHTKSNLLASIGVVAGLLLAWLGFPQADALAGLIVAGFIGKIGFDILMRAKDILVDTACIDAQEVCDSAMQVEGVLNCHRVRARGSEYHVYLDLHIKLDGQISLDKAHEITHRVQDNLRADFPQLVDIVVHTEPGKSA